MNCPGALNLTASMGERKSSVYAAEGTWAHQIREDCLDLGLDAWAFIGQTMYVDGYSFTWKEIDANHLQPGIDRIRQFGGRLTVEYRVDLNKWMPGDFGTLDAGIITEDRIIINDLKWGMGELVEAHQNTQQMIYALGFWQNVAQFETSATEFLLMIDQPRARRRGRGEVMVDFDNLDAEDDEEDAQPAAPGEFRISLDELLEFGKTLRRAVKATEDPDAPRIPGAKQCRWCQAARVEGACPEYEAWNMRTLGLTFENLDEAAELGTMVVPKSTITPERRTVLLRSWPQISKWYARMHANALVDALAGDFDNVPGLKAVLGREGNRAFIDDVTAEAFLSKPYYTDPVTLEVKRGKSIPADKIFTKKLISPAQAETFVGKGKLPSALVVRGKPKPVLVPVSDPKPALVDRKIDLDNLDDDENANE